MGSHQRRYPDYIRALDGNYFLSANYILRRGNGDVLSVFGHLDTILRPISRGVSRLLSRRGSSLATSVDLARQDDLTTHFNAVRDNVLQRMHDSPIVRELLSRPAWDRSSRELWEANLAQIIGDEFYKNPLFNQYRDTGDVLAGGIVTVANVDINGLTPESRFACTEMSILHALMQQLVENEFLQPGGDSLRTRGQYYLATGTVTSSAPIDGRHAWVVSSLTGNVIESTDRENPYCQGVDANHSFDRVLAGYPPGFRPVEMSAAGRSLLPLDGLLVYNTGHDGSRSADIRAGFRLRLFEMGQLSHADTLSGNGMLFTNYGAVRRAGVIRYRELSRSRSEDALERSGAPEADAAAEAPSVWRRLYHRFFSPGL
jgi:hypothetical protein